MDKGEHTRINVNNAKELGSIGGKKSGEVRRRKKEMKEILNTLLSMPYDKGKLTDIETSNSFKNLNGKNVTVSEKLLMQAIKKGMMGDVQAMQFIRDTAGQKPKDEVQIETIKVPKFGGEDELED